MTDRELEQLLDEDSVAHQPVPLLIPWGWRIFLVLLLGFDLVCLVIGKVPWVGGLGRGDVVLAIFFGLGLGLVFSLLAEAIAMSRAIELGLTGEEVDLAAGELSVLTRPVRPGRITILPIIAAIFVVSWLLAKLAFSGSPVATGTLYVVLHAVVGLAVPVLIRSYKRADAAFDAWLDGKNAPLDAEAAKRTKERQEKLEEVTQGIRDAEGTYRERIDAMPRVPPPLYLQPLAIWAIPVLALILDIVLLSVPGWREVALSKKDAGGWLMIWRMICLWVQGCVVIGVVWALLSWYYLAVSDQASRQWSGRDWSVAAVAIEVAMGGLVIGLLVGILAGWEPRFVMFNLLAPAPILIGVLRDIRDTAEEHYDRNVRKRAEEVGPPPDEDEEEPEPEAEEEAEE